MLNVSTRGIYKKKEKKGMKSKASYLNRFYEPEVDNTKRTNFVFLLNARTEWKHLHTESSTSIPTDENPSAVKLLFPTDF